MCKEKPLYIAYLNNILNLELKQFELEVWPIRKFEKQFSPEAPNDFQLIFYKQKHMEHEHQLHGTFRKGK